MSQPFKITFNTGNIHCFCVKPGTLIEFQHQLTTLYPDFYHPGKPLQYLDIDGDLVTLSSELEWQDVLVAHGGRKRMKLSVKLPKIPTPRNSPSPKVDHCQIAVETILVLFLGLYFVGWLLDHRSRYMNKQS